MAATIRPVYYHVFYDPEPDEEGHVREHELKRGADCWCEARAIRVAQAVILVIHDPEDGLDLYEHLSPMNGL